MKIPETPELRAGKVRRMESQWLLKKKALVALYRQEVRRRIDPKHTIELIKKLSFSYPPELWWGLNRITVNINKPLEKVRRSFSATVLDTYRDCPFKYKIQHYFGIAGEESINLILGLAYHEILQRFFEKGQEDFSRESLKAIVKEVLGGKNLEFPSMQKQIMDKAFYDFERYHREYLPREPSQSKMETDFRFELDGDEMTGRIDQINIQPDDSIELVDFKSGSRRYSERDLEDEIQLKIYRLAMDEDSGLRHTKVPHIRMKYLSLGAEKNAEYFLPEGYYDREYLIERLKDLISGIKAERFRAEPGAYNTCSYCDYKIICPRYYGKYD
jgi:DNA helicase-2/ATP-dependent DNA helicase PcrA